MSTSTLATIADSGSYPQNLEQSGIVTSESENIKKAAGRGKGIRYMGRRPNRSNRLNHPSSTEVAQPIPSLPLPRCHPHFVEYSPRTLLLSVASLVSPLEHSGAAVHPHRQRTALGWLLLESRDPQLGSPSPTATWRRP